MIPESEISLASSPEFNQRSRTSSVINILEVKIIDDLGSHTSSDEFSSGQDYISKIGILQVGNESFDDRNRISILPKSILDKIAPNYKKIEEIIPETELAKSYLTTVPIEYF